MADGDATDVGVEDTATTEAASSGGVILALETSGQVGSVAVARGWTVLAHGSAEQRRGHASGLIPLVETVLAEANVRRRELTGLVVGEGPGSFTGVRVAGATAKGLRRALGVPLWGVSSLAAAALSHDGHGVRYVLFDARAERVYGACYRLGEKAVRVLVEAHPGDLADVLDGDVPEGTLFVGDAADKHRARIEAAGHRVAEPGAGVSLAEGLIRYLAVERWMKPVADPSAWEPMYVRASSAEEMWRS